MTVTYVFVLLATLAALAGFFRLLVGPARADRVIALDLLFAVGVVLCICAALASGSPAFLDVAIGLALAGFVGTIAWARLIERQAGEEEGDQ
ncbi:MAG: monovalent cation/H+ antiporter complex subunit F [Gammaproteobacteria bacterium]